MSSTIRMKALASALMLAGVSMGGAAAAAPAHSAQHSGASQATAAVAHATALYRGEQIAGNLLLSHPIHVVIALKLRHKAQLHDFLHTAQLPYAPIVKRTVTPRQFKADYSPTQTQAAAVAAFLKKSGFTHVKISDNRMLVSADGNAGVARSAFNTSFARVQTAHGRIGYMNTAAAHIPASLQGAVLSVIGLQDVHHAHTMTSSIIHSGVQPQAVSGHNPTDFSSIYGGSGVPTASGIPVGIITQGDISQTKQDLQTFTSQNGLASVQTQTVTVNGTSSDTSGVGEWNLDSQDIVGMSGGQVGKLIFYNIPTLSNANLTADFNRVVSDNSTKIINVSLGECETSAQSDGSASADDQIFQQAIAQGQTFSVSSGDSGADECSNGGTTPSYPASSPYVVAVGGTTLNASSSTYSSESTWSGTGGSPSTFESAPSWQSGFVTGSMRGVPDIAFDADPNSGALVIVNGSQQQIGGTSLAAPLFAGSWARMLAAKGQALGFAAPLLYQLPAADFHDVTSGSNGGESAHSGYDYTTGRGSLILNQVVNDIGSGSGGGGGTPPPGGTALQNGTPITGISGSQGVFTDTYTVTIPSGASNLVISESGGSGDADLYVRFGADPTTSTYDCRPYKSGNNESCTFAAPQAGVYHVKLRGYQAFSGVTLEAKWDTSGGGSGGGSNGVFDNPANVTVPDQGTGTSSVNVTGESGNAPSNLQVHVNIQHPYRGDLRITLIAPSGASVVLKQPDGSDGTANVDTTYSVDASSVTANGTWKLQVDDVYAGDSGYIDDFKLTF